jgi:rod shape determining protein RodA
LLAIGLAAKIFFQVVVHIGMNIGLLPVTGIPLPFMSYGGTAIIIDLASIGIILNIYIRHKRAVFS